MKSSYLIAGLSVLLALSALSGAQADPYQAPASSTSSSASTERWPLWYIGITGGYTYMSDQDVSGQPGSASKIKMGDGWGVGGSIGYLPTSSIPFINALRFEGEITYHTANVKHVDYPNGSSIAGSGNYSTTAYMINTFYDLPTGTAWSPYIGGGIGIADIHLPNNSGIGNNSDSDNEFAYQGLVGIGYTPETIPDTQWTLGYRYLATTNPSFSGADTKYSTNNIEAGAKFRF